MANDSSGSTPKSSAGAKSSVRPGAAESKERAVRANEGRDSEGAEESFEDLEPTQFDDDEPPQRRVDPEWDDNDEDDTAQSDEPTNEPDEGVHAAEDEEELDDGSPERSAPERLAGQRDPARGRGMGRGGQSSRGSAPREERRPPPSSAEELLLSEIPYRLGRVEQKLRQNLAGRIALRITSGPERRSSDSRNSDNRSADSRSTETRYLFDWSGDSPSIQKLDTGVQKGAAEHASPDCTISIHEQVLLRIANGELNPQITMLSDRLKIDGQSSLGIYFFNLVAPST